MSDINIQTFSGKVSVKNDLRVGQGHLFVDTAANQVGLNSLTPQANLHVTGNTYVTSDLRVGSKVLIDSSAADSNVLVVTGGGIKADFILGDGRSQWTTTGNDVYYTGGVAIGSSQTPTTALDVTGSGTFSGDLTAAFLHGDGSNISNITSSQWTTVNTNELYYALGNVGIGNQNPNYTLDVTGDINFTGDLYQNGTIFSGGGGGGGSGFWQAGTGTKIYYSAGEVGIANTNPQHTLSVGSNLYVEDTGSNVLVVDGNVACTQLTLGQFEIVPSYGLGDVTAESNVTTDTVELNNATTGLSTVANVVVGGELTVSGNAVVSSNLTVSGNAAVSSNLTVTGNVTVTEDLTVTGNAAVSSNLTVSGNITVDTDTLFVDTTNNSVAIGTTVPQKRLHVLHTDNTPTGLLLENTGTGNEARPHIEFKNDNASAYIQFNGSGRGDPNQLGILNNDGDTYIRASNCVSYDNVYWYGRGKTTVDGRSNNFHNTGGQTEIEIVERSKGDIGLNGIQYVRINSVFAEGIYVVYCHVSISTGGTKERGYIVELVKNGTTVFASGRVNVDHITQTTYNQAVVSGIINLSNGDYVSHQTPSNTNFQIHTPDTRFYMYRISSL